MDGEGLVGRARKRLIANPTISKEKKIGAPDWCGAVMFTDKFIKLIRMTWTNQWTNFFSNRARFIRIELKGIHSLEVWAKSLISLYIPFSRIVIVSSTTCFYGFAWESNKAWAMLILWGLIQISSSIPFSYGSSPPLPSPLQSGPQHLYRRDTMRCIPFATFSTQQRQIAHLSPAPSRYIFVISKILGGVPDSIMVSFSHFGG